MNIANRGAMRFAVITSSYNSRGIVPLLFNLTTWAQLFEGRLALNPGLNLTPVSFSCVQSIFSDNFLCYFKSIQSSTCRQTVTEMLFKLNSNLALTLGYVNPALNNVGPDV